MFVVNTISVDDVYAREKIYVELSNAPTPTFDDICDRPEPYEVPSYITLMKEGERQSFKSEKGIIVIN